MRQVKVIYSRSSTTAVRDTLSGLSRWVRVEADPASLHTIVFLDKDLPWYHKDGTDLIFNVLGLMQEGGHEPFWAPVGVAPRKEVNVDNATGELKFQYEQKHHFEHIGKPFRIAFRVADQIAWDSIGVTDVYLMGPHSAVRKVKRRLANKLSNDKRSLHNNDLSELAGWIGDKVGVYFLTDNNTVINVKDREVVTMGGWLSGVTDRILDNTQTAITGKFVKRISTVTSWCGVLNIAKGV